MATQSNLSNSWASCPISRKGLVMTDENLRRIPPLTLRVAALFSAGARAEVKRRAAARAMHAKYCKARGRG